MSLKEKYAADKHRVLWAIALGLVKHQGIAVSFGVAWVIGDEVVTGVVNALIVAGLVAFDGAVRDFTPMLTDEGRAQL